MKKPIEILLIILGVLLGIYLLLSLTGIFKIYKVPSIANEPGIKLNSMIFSSNLVDYKNGDFVCFKYNDDLFGKQIRVHRLLGKSGDIVEIKNGILYLNNENIDKNLELAHMYILDRKDFQILLNKKLVKEEILTFQTKDKILVSLIDKQARQNGLSEKIRVEPKGKANKTIKTIYNNNWNSDNFGPIKIANGKCFVIGDNRHNSEDSRYIGLINESDIIGTIIK
jgi:signal peptidase I